MPTTKTHAPDRTIPTLDGWLTAEQASDVLKVSRTTTHRWFADGVFASQHAVGDRPLYIVRAEEVARLLKLYDQSSYTTWTEALNALADEASRWRVKISTSFGR